MKDDEHGESQDPLLVRPFILRDSGSADGSRGDDDDTSTQTWPSATTRETRSQRAMEGADDPTAVIVLDPEETKRSPRRRRRLLAVIVAGGLVLLGAGAAGYAVLGPGLRPSVSAALPGEPLPAVTGPQTTSTARSATSASSPPARQNEQPPVTSTTTTTGSAAATTASTSPAAGPATTASGGNRPSTISAPDPTAALAPGPIAARTGTVRGQNGVCLDLSGAVPFDGNHIQVYECNGSLAQLWTLATDGTLRVLGKCALVVGDNTVHIVACDGRTPAQWRVSGQRLINVATGGCLTDPAGGRTSGTTATVTACNGSANQRWSLP